MSRTLVLSILAVWFLVFPRIGSSEPFQPAPALAFDELAQLDVARDPECLMMTGFVSSDGSVVLHSLDELPQGAADLDPDESSEYSIDLVDDDGRLISEYRYEPAFEKITESWDGRPALITVRPFGALMETIEYPRTTARVQFKKSGIVMLEIDPVSESLRRMILSVPDAGYTKNPAERRNALLEKVKAFEGMLASKNLKGAESKLGHDIRPRIEEWMIDYPARISLHEYSKERILTVIASIEARLEARNASRKSK